MKIIQQLFFTNESMTNQSMMDLGDHDGGILKLKRFVFFIKKYASQ